MRQLLSSSSKVHLTTACLSPSVSHTEAEAERTTQNAWIWLKGGGEKKKIYKKGKKHLVQRETEWEIRKPAEPQIIQQRQFQEKDAEIQI